MKPVCLALALVGWAAWAHATSVRALSEDEQVRTAHMIVRGEVARLDARKDASGFVVTDVTVAVDRLLKGPSGRKTVVFTQLGGTLEGVTLRVAGSSTYTVGEKVVVFLAPGGLGLVELGVGRAKRRVIERNGRAWVEYETPAPELLDAFEARILRLLRAADGPRPR